MAVRAEARLDEAQKEGDGAAAEAEVRAGLGSEQSSRVPPADPSPP